MGFLPSSPLSREARNISTLCWFCLVGGMDSCLPVKGQAMKLNSKVKNEVKMPKIRNKYRRKWLPPHTQHNYTVCLLSLFQPISSIVKFHTFNMLSSLLFCVYPVTQSAKHPSLCQPTSFQSTHRKHCVLFLVYGVSPGGPTWSDL